MSNINPRKVFVSSISRDAREGDLAKLFEQVGRIETLIFRNTFAFVEFETKRECKDAIYKFDGLYFMGRKLRVLPYSYRHEKEKTYDGKHPKSYAVYVTDLHSTTTWQDLRNFGTTAGKSVVFTNVRFMKGKNEDNHTPKEGIILYSDDRDFEYALQILDGAQLNGVRVRVSGNKSQISRYHGGNRNVSRPRLRSRSRSRSRSSSNERSRSRGRARSYPRDRQRRKFPWDARTRSESRSRNASTSYSRTQSQALSRSPSPIRFRSRGKIERKGTNNVKIPSHSRSKSRSPSK